MTRLISFSLTFELDFETSYLVKTGYGEGGVHHALLRNRDRLPFLPASSIKGRFRHYARQFATLPALANRPAAAHRWEELFGSVEKRGRIYFADAYPTDPYKEMLEQLDAEIRASIQIERRLRSTAQHHLHFSELPPSQLVFASSLEGQLVWPESGKPADCHDLGYLLATLRLFDHIGAQKTRGLGFARIREPELVLNLPDKKKYDGAELAGLLAVYLERQLEELT